MGQSFQGSIEELKSLVQQAGLKGDLSDDGHGKHSFRHPKGGVLNWWPSKGTLHLQGKSEAKAIIEKTLSPVLEGSPRYDGRGELVVTPCAPSGCSRFSLFMATIIMPEIS